MSLAFVYPGQGAQALGMGRALADEYDAARRVFEAVDDALGEKLTDVIWGDDEAALTLTANAQPALMATSMAAMAALGAEGVDVRSASFVAGHSLGEYSALCAAGALSLADTARLLRIRGEAMQAAVPVGEGAMAALLGVDLETARLIAAEAAQRQVLQAANDNDPSQVVISGAREAVERAVAIAKDHGAKRAVLLPVSAPFHCKLMEPAARRMAEALDDVEIMTPKVPVIVNVRAYGCTSRSDLRSYLVEQVTGMVRWRESVMHMGEHGVREVWEIGAGKALSGMVKRVNREIETRAVGTPDEVRAAAAALGE